MPLVAARPVMAGCRKPSVSFRAFDTFESVFPLEPGKRADIVVHTLDRPEMIPVTNMIRNLFYASRSKSVHTVIIDGKVVLENGRFVALDERRLLAEINKAAQSLLARMGHTVVANALPRTERRG